MKKKNFVLYFCDFTFNKFFMLWNNFKHLMNF